MDDRDIDSHPDLMDPEWRRHAVREALAAQRQGRRWAIVGVAMVVVAVSGFAFYRWGKATSDQSTPGSADAVTTLAMSPAPAPAGLPDFAHVDLSRPFDGTPAQNWAEGVAGLTIPSATKVGEFSAAQVSSALGQVKQAITVAYLDPVTIVEHKPDKYLGLLAPDARNELRGDLTYDVAYLEDGFHLLPSPSRLTGGLTVGAGGTGELNVHASYVIAYAFDPGGEQIYGPSDIEPFVRIEADYVVRSGPHWMDSSHGLWPEHVEAYFTGAACGPIGKGHIAPAYSDHRPATTTVRDVPGEFDPTKPMPTLDTCR